MNRLILALLVGFVALLILFSSATFTVYPNQQAIVLKLGKFVRPAAEPGLYFKFPILEKVVFIDRRVLIVEGDKQEVLTRDQARIVVDYFARYRIEDPLLFFQTARSEEGMSTRLAPIITSQLRRVLAEQPMSRVLTPDRAEIMREITAAVEAQVRNFGTSGQGFGIQIIDVRIKRVDLPKENSDKVYLRMQTQRQQEAQRLRSEGEAKRKEIQAEADKKRRILLAEAEQKASVLRGEGDAEATRIYNEAFGQDPAFFDFFRSLQAMENGLPSATTTYVGPASGDFFRFFGNEQGVKGTGDPIGTGQ